MRLTKFTHSCVRIEDGDRALVVDPGVFSETEDALDGANAILVTHEHPDHLDVDTIRAALHRDSRLQLFAPASVTAMLDGFADQVGTVSAGEAFAAAGIPVQAYGGQHALIHPAIPMVANLGYLIGGRVFHPGDSFTVPDAAVSTVLLPLNAPWSKAAEVIDYAISVRAPRAYQIHDALVNDNYTTTVGNHIKRIAGPHGVEFQHLAPRTSVEV